MSVRGGKAVRVVMGKEDAPGTGAATPKGYILPFASVRFADSQGSADSDEIVAGSNPGQPFEDTKAASGELVVAATCGVWALIIKWLTGNLVTTETPSTGYPYTHVGKAQDADPATLWLERGHLDVNKFDLFKYVRPHSVKMSATKKAGLLKFTVGLTGTGNASRNVATAYDAAPVEFTDRRLNAKDVTVKVDTVTSKLVKSIDVTLERSADPALFLDGTDEAAGVDLGGWTVKAEITAAWDDADTMRALAADKGDHVFEITAPDGVTNLVGIKLPQARVFDSGSGEVGNRGPLEVKVSVTGYLAGNADLSSFVLTAINDKAATFYEAA